MKLTLAHGSNATPEEPLNFKFQLFDYVIRQEISLDKRINNGNDGDGPGIYTVSGGQEAWNFADKYAGNQGEGTTFGLEVEVEELSNEQDPDHISEEIWSKVIEVFIESRHEQEGFDRKGVINFFQNNHENIENDCAAWMASYKDDIKVLMGNVFHEGELGYLIDDMILDPDTWEEILTAYLDVSDPACYIYDEGGPENLPSYAINRSENLLETLQHIWRACAISNASGGRNTYNETFYNAMQHVPDHLYPKAAMVDEDVYVIFDMNAIEVKCAQRRTFTPETITKVNEIIITLEKIKPITNKYSVEEGAIAIMAEVEKQHDVKLSEKTAKIITMSRKIDDFVVKTCREDVGVQIIEDFEITPGCMNELKGIASDILEADLEGISNRKLSI